jgi:hypothetical protein
VLAQPGCEALGRCSVDIEQRDRSGPLSGNRGGDRRADPADQTIRAGKVEALALCLAHKASAVEQLAIERAVRTAKDGIAGAGHLHCQSGLIEQIHSGNFVGHRHERTADVAEAK